MSSSSPLRKTNSSRLHPLKSFSTSRLLSRRPAPPQNTSIAEAAPAESGTEAHPSGFLSQLKRSFTHIGGHRSSSSTAAAASTSLDHHHHPGFFSQLKRTFTLRGHRSSSSAAATSLSSGVDQHAGHHAEAGKASKGLPPRHPWGWRVKHGLIKPLQVVRDGYVDCMMGVAEDPRLEGLVGMGFQGATYEVDHTRLFRSASNYSGAPLRRSASTASSAAVLTEAGYHFDDAQLETILHNNSTRIRPPINIPGHDQSLYTNKPIANIPGNGQSLYTNNKPIINMPVHGQSLYSKPIPE